MAIVISKMYENYTPKETIISDIRDVWEWLKVEEDTEKQSVKFYVNENTYFEIYEPENYAAKSASGSPTIDLKFKETTIHTVGGFVNALRYKAFIHIVKTNKSTLIQYSMTSQAVTEAPLETLTWILSTATNYSTGDNEAIVAYQTTPSTLGNGDYNCVAVLSDDIAADNIATTRFQGALSQNKILLLPLHCNASLYIMDDVYLLYQSQLGALYRGECTLNSRNYYMSNWLMVPDE